MHPALHTDHLPLISIFIVAPTFSFDENVCFDNIGKRKFFLFSYMNHKVCTFLKRCGKIKLATEKLQTILVVVYLLQFTL